MNGQTIPLHDRDWDDLAFYGRNKSYGAYSLRKNYGLMLMYSFAVTVSVFMLLLLCLDRSVASDVALAKPQHNAVYYQPKLPPPPIALEPRRNSGVVKGMRKTIPSPKTAPYQAPVVQPTPNPVEDPELITDLEATARPNLDEPSDGIDDEQTAGRQPGGGSNIDSSTVSSGNLIGAERGNEKRLFLYAAVITKNGQEVIWWMFDDNLRLRSRKINLFSQDVQNLFGIPRYADKGPFQSYVRVNEFQAVNVAYISEIEESLVVLVTGDKIGVDYEYMRILKKRMKLYEDKYGF